MVTLRSSVRTVRRSLLAGFLSFVLALSASSSLSVAGASNPSAQATKATKSYETAILRIWSDVLASGAAGHRDAIPPGLPLSSRGGGSNSVAAARDAEGVVGLVAACLSRTTSYVAQSLSLITAFSGPRGAASLRKAWRSMTLVTRTEFEQHLSYVNPGAPKPTVRSVRLVSESGGTAKVDVSVVDISNFGRSTSNSTIEVSLLGGRWFASSMMSFGFGASGSPSFGASL